MRDLAVAAVRDNSRGEQARRTPLGCGGEKAVEPCGKLGLGQNAAHQQRLGQGGGQEFIAARFPSLTIPVLGEPCFGLLRDQGGECGVPRFRPVARQNERERDIVMRANAQRIGQLWQEAVKTVRKSKS